MSRPAAPGGTVTLHCKYDDRTLIEMFCKKVCTVLTDTHPGSEYTYEKLRINPKYVCQDEDVKEKPPEGGRKIEV